MDILEGLNPAQRQAVETPEGPLLILAGPGSGKTKVITHRVAYLIKAWGISPYRIMAVTFTNKAANEMRERLHQLLGQRAEELTLGTFHAICARFLRRDGQEIGIDPHFVIYDEEDQLNLLKRALQDLDLDPRYYNPKALGSAIRAAKARLIGPEDYARQVTSYRDEVVRRVYGRYQELLAQSRALDFDDLLMEAVRLLRQPRVLAKYQSRYLHVLIDEFQDTNIAQYVLAKQLAGQHRNICVVGDPDQSIYSWRFADLRNILNFEKDYPDARIALLEQNYRSSKAILELASHIIAANKERKPKGLWTENEVGLPPTVAEVYDEQEEAQFVARQVESLAREGFAPGDCAVMYRTNAQSRVLEETFVRYGLPYKLVGGTRFYERREVKDVIAYLRLIVNPDDNISLLRVINTPPRGIGQRTVAELSRWAQARELSLYQALKQLAEGERDSGPFTARTRHDLNSFLSLVEGLAAQGQELHLHDLIQVVLERSGYKEYILNEPDGEDRWDNVLELCTLAQEYQHLEPGEGLTSFLEGVTLVSDVDSLDEKVNAVTLITLHQAKGLEFPVVFIVGLEEGVLPHIRSFDDPAQMEEERRLCYVGVTRAKRRLFLVRALRRSLAGLSGANPPSRFLLDIPPSLVSSAPSGLGVPEPKVLTPAPAPSLPHIRAGDRVRHAKFGEGVVVSCQPSRDDQEVTVAFAEAGVRKLLLSLAPLEKLG